MNPSETAVPVAVPTEMQNGSARLILLRVALVGVTIFTAGVAAAADGSEAGDFFEKEVRPLLVARCYKCHSQTDDLKGGLSLSSRAALLAGGETGPAAVPGKPTESLLVEAVRYQGIKMPPTARLPQDEIDKLVRWVELGLPWPESPSPPPSPAGAEQEFTISDAQRAFWSFQPVVATAPPAVRDAGWPASGIDRFILARLETGNLRANPAADKQTLIRRATFDLTGLPPTPDEIAEFLADASPEAFERVVDRLLAAPAYGERWGRHWLDVVRYADTAGETADYPVREAYKYRNWVIDAFNRDMPYDEFIREQIAGDILARSGPRELYAQRVTATGYLAISRRFGYDSENYHHLTIADTLDVLGRSVLGLSIGCARCHDHKYDPISMADYYALYGIFASSRYSFPGSEEKNRPRDLVPLLPAAEAAPLEAARAGRLATCDAEVKQAEGELAAAEKMLTAMADEIAKTELTTKIEALKVAKTELTTKIEALKASLGPARARRDEVANSEACELTYGVVEGQAANAKIQKRGEPKRLGEEVPRRFLEILGGDAVADASGSGRLDLADWLTRPENPLVARVIVNRLWQHHFGAGLVQTASDFGYRGRPPSHPQLLDYLADALVCHGWSLKWLHKEIMLSRVYQLSSDDANPAAVNDPLNVLCWKYGRHRLDAEAIRDAMLAVSGNLDRARGAAHPFPPKQSWHFTQHAPFKAVYETPKRSVYLMTQRIARHPFLALFDGADPNVSTAERTETTTPAQALFLMNDPFTHEQSAALAKRLMREAADERRRLEWAHWLVLGRAPSNDELPEAAAFLERYRHLAISTGAAGEDVEQAAWSAYARVLLTSNEFLYIE